MKYCAILFTVTLLNFAACQSTSSGTQKTTFQAKTTTFQPISDTTDDTIECIDDKNSKIRTFSTLTEYQGNKFSFSPENSTYQGNIVKFNTSNPIERLEKYSFVSFGSQSIIKLDLCNIQAQYLDPGAFLQLFCLQQLNLSHNNLRNLSEGSFEGLQNLKELDVSFNQLQGIPDNGQTFFTLKSIRVLNLSNNEINSLDKLSFMTLDNLELLDLGYNKIKTLDPRVFNYLGALKKLYINNNLLQDTSAEEWKGLNNLTDLDISNNNIRSFDMTNNYSFINLRNLDLSGNRLFYLNLNNLGKVLPNLSILDISDNNWLCEDLDIIRQTLKDSRVTLPRPVNCSEVTITSTKRTPTTTTERPLNPAANSRHDYGPQIVYQNKELLYTNTKIEENIEDVKSVLICLFVVFVLCLIAELGIRLGLCRRWYYCLVGRSYRGYLDTNDDESVGLMSR